MGTRDGELGKRPTVPCGISDIRRAGGGLQSKSQRAVGAERRQIEAQGRQRKQLCETWLSRGYEPRGRRKGSGGNRVWEVWAFLMHWILTGDSPSTRGPSPTRRAPLRPFRSRDTLIQVSRAIGSLLLQRGMDRFWALLTQGPSHISLIYTLTSQPQGSLLGLPCDLCTWFRDNPGKCPV